MKTTEVSKKVALRYINWISNNGYKLTHSVLFELYSEKDFIPKVIVKCLLTSDFPKPQPLTLYCGLNAMKMFDKLFEEEFKKVKYKKK